VCLLPHLYMDDMSLTVPGSEDQMQPGVQLGA
jgi:hypothetical protein